MLALSDMGKTAVKSHAFGKKHKTSEEISRIWFSKWILQEVDSKPEKSSPEQSEELSTFGQ